MNTLRYTAAAVAALFVAYSMVTPILLLKAQSDANKGQQRAMVCFDASGKVTYADHFKECRLVAIRELH